jgi:hypothetical protein
MPAQGGAMTGTGDVAMEAKEEGEQQHFVDIIKEEKGNIISSRVGALTAQRFKIHKGERETVAQLFSPSSAEPHLSRRCALLGYCPASGPDHVSTLILGFSHCIHLPLVISWPGILTLLVSC